MEEGGRCSRGDKTAASALTETGESMRMGLVTPGVNFGWDSVNPPSHSLEIDPFRAEGRHRRL